MSATYLLVADLESTGNVVDYDEIIEAAFILVDAGTLTELARWEQLLTPTRKGMARLLATEEVRKMHVASGLLNDLALNWTGRWQDSDSADTERAMDELEALVVQSLQQMGSAGVMQADTVHLAGSGIGHFDRPMINKHMRGLALLLHYAPIDVGVFRRMVKLWSDGDLSTDNAAKNHRAMSDCEGSLNELRAAKAILGNAWTASLPAVP